MIRFYIDGTVGQKDVKNRFKISGNNIALTITTSNKITDTNSCLFLMCAYMNKDKASELYPINLINFSFTETAL